MPTPNSLTAKMLAENHLCVKHPNSARLGSNEINQKTIINGNDYTMYAPYQHSITPPVIKHLPNQHAVPFTNYKKFEENKVPSPEKLKQYKITSDGRTLKVPYEGTHVVPYQSAFEIQAAEEKKRREKSIAGPFKNAIGAASVIPVREGGVVQNSGPYLQENIFVQSTEQKLLAGPWRPVQAKPSK